MKKLALILSIIILAALTANITFAGDQKASTGQKVEKLEMLTGKVVSTDTVTGKIVIMSNDKENTLQAQPNMLEGIMAGQYVKIEKTGDVVKSIKAEKNE